MKTGNPFQAALCTSRAAVFIAAFVFSLAVPPAGGQEAVPAGPRPPSFPNAFGIDVKWDAFQRAQPAPAAVQALIQDDREGRSVVACGERQYASVWAATDRRLVGEAELLKGVRVLEDADAWAALATARRSGEPARLLAACRRYPWAAATHAALCECGEELVREGRPGLALRCFQDVLRRAGTVELLGRAQVGVWTAEAHLARSPVEIELAFRGVDATALYPWMGRPAAAKTICERLVAGWKPPPAPADPASVGVLPLQLPDRAFWILQFDSRLDAAGRSQFLPQEVQPLAAGEGVLVAGPNLLAWYDRETLDKPRWTHTVTTPLSGWLWARLAPGPFRPTILGGTIYTRWGIEQSAQRRDDEGNQRPNHLNDIAAFDCATGRLLWSTSGDPAWQGLCPAGDPAYADGRLYVLALEKGRAYCQVVLAALDARSGDVLWKRDLAAGHTDIEEPDGPHQRRRPRPRGKPQYDNNIDPVRFGNAVTVEHGAVYCSTGMGVAARCDARDGLIEWIATYPRNPEDADPAVFADRWGSPPLVVGGAAVFAPRDTTTVFALDRETGRGLWQRLPDFSSMPPGSVAGDSRQNRPVTDDERLEALTAAGGNVLVTNGRQVAALDAASGLPHEIRKLDEPAQSLVALAGPHVHLRGATRLMRVEALTASVCQATPWGGGKAVAGVAWSERSVLAAVPGAEGVRAETARRREDDRDDDRPPRPANRPDHVVYRSPQPWPPTADPADWEPHPTVAWKDRDGRECSILLAHDDANLYVGLSRPTPNCTPRQGPGLAGGGDLLEVAIWANWPLHCTVGVDELGRARLESLGRSSLPEGIRAAVSHNVVQGRLSYEVAVPIVGLWGRDGDDFRPSDHWRRPRVVLAPRADGAPAGNAGQSVELGRFSATLYLHAQTHSEIAAGDEPKTAVPPRDEEK